MTEPGVVVVVVAYGHAPQLPATLRSIMARQYPADKLQVVVVDNGGGESAAVARTEAPTALVLEPGRNLGFAGGCNFAVARSSAENIVLVNPDVELRPGCLRALVTALRDPSVGVAGAKLLFPAGNIVQHAGGTLDLPLALTSHRGHSAPDAPAYDQPTDVAYVTGAALAARRDTWTRLGGFDEAFAPAYYEEVDLCFRARQAGLRVRYAPAAVALHGETSSLGGKSVAFYRLYHANRLRFLFKHWDDRWLAHEWLLAELLHLRTTADDNEIEGLRWSYGAWQTHFVTGGAPLALQIDGWQAPPAAPGPPPGSELAWTLEQAAAKRSVTPRPFTSSIPGVARLRRWITSLATEEYLRPIIQQQNDFNATLVELAVALERQRRTTDAAVLLQGMFLAKVFASQPSAVSRQPPGIET
jgi:GT2 family glycosyltransferase